MEPATEKVLLDRSRSGDRGALGELLMAHHAACYSLALRLAGNPADAEDICQKAFLNVIRDISRDCAITNFRSWLLRIVVCAYRHQRRADIARRQRERSRAMESPDITKPAGSSTVEREELRRQLEISLGQLGEDYRLPIFLHYEQGLSYAEVATVLQMPEGTVATNIRRGLGKLRDLMARAGYSGAVPAMVAALQQAPATSVPASLTAFIKNLAPGPVAGGSASPAGDMDAVGPAGEMDAAGPAGGADAGGATGATNMAGAAGAKGSSVPIAATKGGTAMRIMICAATALLTAAVGILVPEYIGWDRSSASGGSAGAKVTGGKVAGGKEAEKPLAGESKAAEGTPPAGPNGSRPPLAITPVGTNPVTEPQNREEVFDFAEKPRVEKQGGKWVITFASKGKCDATVAIVGPDGKIVRHLASGVLGANAPWPFQQGSLSQTLEWDGKDDFGRPAPAGCKVRVGLGLKASYGAAIAAMDPYAIDPSAIACDREGNAYVLMNSFSNNYFDATIRVFSREGKYLRTIMPMPAGLPPEKYAGTFDLVGPPENPYYVLKSKEVSNSQSMGMAVSPQGRLVFSVHGNRTHKFLRFLNTDGSGLCRGPQLGPWQCVIGRALVAFSNDGKSVFVGALTKSEIGGKGAIHAVLRFGVDDPTPKEWLNSHKWADKAPIFAGDLNTPGADDAHFNEPRGVAVDKDNNVYVCDYGNNRIQVFDPGAKLLRSIKVDRPDQIAVHRKTGAVYVLCLGGWKEGMRLVKFSADGKEVCTFRFPGAWPNTGEIITNMAMDDSAEPPIVWVAGPESLGLHRPKGIWLIADRGASFEKLGDIWKPESSGMGWPGTCTQYISVDRDDRYLYVRGHKRYDTRTGQLDKNWKLPDWTAELTRIPGTFSGLDEHYIGPDGLLYLRNKVNTQGQDAPKPGLTPRQETIYRIDPETGKEVPFPAAPGGRIAYPGWFAGRYFRDGFTVAPNGDIYVIVYHEGLRQYGPDGALKRDNIMKDDPPDYKGGRRGGVGWATPFPGGLRVDRAGNILMPLRMYPIKAPYPEILRGIEPLPKNVLDGSAFFRGGLVIGTLFKFGPEGGAFEGQGGDWGGYAMGLRFGGSFSPKRDVKVVGAKALHVGVGPFGHECVCQQCRIDLDGFDRAYVPIMHISTVMVLDANFNRVARIGNYGNMDCNGPQSACPKPEIGLAGPFYVAVSDRSVYILDGPNCRILRADLGYHTDETVPLP